VKSVRLPSTATTPEIIFDPLLHRVDIRGHCHPARPEALFDPLMTLLRRHFSTRQPLLFTVHLALQYVDKAGLHALRELCRLMDTEGRSGRWIELIWTTEPDDLAQQGLGECLVDGLSHLEYLPSSAA
jgi:hypothetical protein